jgi:hypothetical protein
MNAGDKIAAISSCLRESLTTLGQRQFRKPADSQKCQKNFEAKSKLLVKASHGDFRQFLYEALGKSIP